MIYKMKKGNYSKLKNLVKDFNHQLCAISLIDGNNNGEVYVDNLDNPQSAILYTTEGTMFVGNPHNLEFNKEVKEYLSEWSYLVCDSEQWEDNITEALKSAELKKHQRLDYRLTELKYKNWRENLPEGFIVVPINKDFARYEEYKNFKSTADHADSEDWNPKLKMEEFGYGFAVIDEENKVITSSCTIDCLTKDNRIEIGIRTSYKYRRKGLAAIAVAATVEDYLSKGITEIGWQCLANNKGSFKTAEKIGFKRTKLYNAFAYNIGDAENVSDFTREEWLSNAKLLEEKGDLHSLDWAVYCYAAAGEQEKALNPT